MRRKGGGDSGGGGERRGEGFKNPDRIPGIPVASSPVPQSTPPIRIHKASAKHPQSIRKVESLQCCIRSIRHCLKDYLMDCLKDCLLIVGAGGILPADWIGFDLN